MYKLIMQKRAINSIIQTVEYIREDNPFYANQVQEYIKQSINLLSDYPLLWFSINDKNRAIIEPKYKFKIVYRVKWNTIYIIWVYREQKSW
jgi:hypothetical protein